jgi:hypothetical protein
LRDVLAEAPEGLPRGKAEERLHAVSNVPRYRLRKLIEKAHLEPGIRQIPGAHNAKLLMLEDAEIPVRQFADSSLRTGELNDKRQDSVR